MTKIIVIIIIYHFWRKYLKNEASSLSMRKKQIGSVFISADYYRKLMRFLLLSGI